MELKEKLLDSHLAFEEQSEVNEIVQNHRSRALRIFQEKGFPTKKIESWKYTSLNSLLNKDYVLFPRTDSNIELKKVKQYFLHDIDTYKIVFIDGIYSPFLSDTTHDGLDVCLLSAALSQIKYREVIDKYFNKSVIKDESLTALNTAYAREGAYIFIPENKVSEKPIEIMHFSTGEQKSLWLQPRNLIVVEKNSQVQIIERHQS